VVVNLLRKNPEWSGYGDIFILQFWKGDLIQGVLLDHNLILPNLPMLLDIGSSLRSGSSKLKSRKKGENRGPFNQQTSSTFRVTSEASPRGATLLSLSARANFLWTAFPQAWRSFAQLV